MNQIILNERAYAEECLRNRPVGKPSFQTLSILARYYYHVCGLRKKKIYEALMEYVSKSNEIQDYERGSWEDSIEKLSSNASRYKLYEIDGVGITRAELDVIDNLDSKVLRRLAFTMLCLAKLGDLRNQNNNGWVRQDAKDIFKLARISCGVCDREMKIGALYQKKLLEFPKRNDNMNCRVTYINNESDVVLYVSDFRELGYEYLKYCGENIIRCRECGILTRGNKNGTKIYCENCAAPMPKKIKTLVCIDCGEEFEVSSKNNQKTRCPYCYDIYRREYKRVNEKKRRDSSSAWTEQKKDDF